MERIIIIKVHGSEKFFSHFCELLLRWSQGVQTVICRIYGNGYDHIKGAISWGWEIDGLDEEKKRGATNGQQG